MPLNNGFVNPQVRLTENAPAFAAENSLLLCQRQDVCACWVITPRLPAKKSKLLEKNNYAVLETRFLSLQSNENLMFYTLHWSHPLNEDERSFFHTSGSVRR
jgi:hypothetical protein